MTEAMKRALNDMCSTCPDSRMLKCLCFFMTSVVTWGHSWEGSLGAFGRSRATSDSGGPLVLAPWGTLIGPWDRPGDRGFILKEIMAVMKSPLCFGDR